MTEKEEVEIDKFVYEIIQNQLKWSYKGVGANQYAADINSLEYCVKYIDNFQNQVIGPSTKKIF